MRLVGINEPRLYNIPWNQSWPWSDQKYTFQIHSQSFAWNLVNARIYKNYIIDKAPILLLLT